MRRASVPGESPDVWIALNQGKFGRLGDACLDVFLENSNGSKNCDKRGLSG